jgi:tRNA threonylcarbamoyladenosine biosynthesis protein TsaB
MILALESSAKAASAAVVADGRLLGQYFQNSGLTHSVTLMCMARDLLRNLNLTARDFDVFAAAAGPGSFTGVRIGVAAVKGLAWGAGKPVCGVSTLEAIAWMAEPCEDGVVCPMMDARRGQVYNAKFTRADGAPARVCEDRAISSRELIAECASGGNASFLLAGDAAALCLPRFLESGLRARLAPESAILPCAHGVALAAARGVSVKPGEMRPNYIRAPQAEREAARRKEWSQI